VKYELRPAFAVGPYDIAVGALPTGPASPVTVAVPELPDAVANLARAGLLETIISYDTEETADANGQATA